MEALADARSGGALLVATVTLGESRRCLTTRCSQTQNKAGRILLSRSKVKPHVRQRHPFSGLSEPGSNLSFRFSIHNQPGAASSFSSAVVELNSLRKLWKRVSARTSALSDIAGDSSWKLQHQQQEEGIQSPSEALPLQLGSLLAARWSALRSAASSLSLDAQRRGGWVALVDEQRVAALRKLWQINWQQVAESVGDTAVACWKEMAPWIKWPATIFAAFFSLVVVVFGMPVALDLTPLWILGPICSAAFMWEYHQAAMAMPALRAAAARLTVAAAAGSVTFAEYAQSGRLLADTRAAAQSARERLLVRQREVRSIVVTKRGELAAYVRSGRLTADFKEGARAKGAEFAGASQEWALQGLEDLSDWWFVARRRLAKFLKKVF